jgi:hypothetical protein
VLILNKSIKTSVALTGEYVRGFNILLVGRSKMGEGNKSKEKYGKVGERGENVIL